jgi:hypothetical protein
VIVRDDVSYIEDEYDEYFFHTQNSNKPRSNYPPDYRFNHNLSLSFYEKRKPTERSQTFFKYPKPLTSIYSIYQYYLQYLTYLFYVNTNQSNPNFITYSDC